MVGWHSAGPGQTPLFAHLPPPQGPGVAAVEHTFGSLLTSSLLSLGGRGGGLAVTSFPKELQASRLRGKQLGLPAVFPPLPPPTRKSKEKDN